MEADVYNVKAPSISPKGEEIWEIEMKIMPLFFFEPGFGDTI